MFQGAHGAEMNLGQEPANQPVNITAVVTNQKSMLITCQNSQPKTPHHHHHHHHQCCVTASTGSYS